jgi:hypothetical protein
MGKSTVFSGDHPRAGLGAQRRLDRTLLCDPARDLFR